MTVILNFILAKLVDLMAILFVFMFGKVIIAMGCRRLARISDSFNKRQNDRMAKRTETLQHIIRTNGNIVLSIVIFLMLLNLVGVNIGPILAGLGVLGLAVGFGAQALVKDFVAGVLILIENQFNIGDKIKIGDAIGQVEKITLRSTILKDDEGKVFYIANGSITSVVNYSQR